MSYDKLLALICDPNPTPEDIATAAALMADLSPETLNALAVKPGVHPTYRAMLRKEASTRTAIDNIDEQVTNITKRMGKTPGPAPSM